MDKFLRTAWKENPENGEANFDIRNDELGTIDLFEGQKLTKIELFQSELKKTIFAGKIKNNRDAYLFTLDRGHIPQHASDVMDCLKKEGRVTFASRSPKIAYEHCYKKGVSLLEYRLIR